MQRVSRRAVLATALTAGTLGLVRVSVAQTPPTGRRIALKGYDPVAYFEEAQPQKGHEALWFAFDDAVYLFKSAEHRAKFIADPCHSNSNSVGLAQITLERKEAPGN